MVSGLLVPYAELETVCPCRVTVMESGDAVVAESSVVRTEAEALKKESRVVVSVVVPLVVLEIHLRPPP